MFDLVDPRPSQFWLARKQGDYALTLWPEEFYTDYFKDDLTEGVKSVRETFAKVAEKLERESLD
jgi:hypothetical protein